MPDRRNWLSNLFAPKTFLKSHRRRRNRSAACV